MPDPEVPAARSRDPKGALVTEQWGWLGKGEGPLRVRQLTLHRDGEEPIVLVSDLTDAGEHPAPELLDLYRARWGIEGVFRQITEVFGLARFIGSSPEATVFQACFCLLVYDLIGVLKGYVAHAGGVAESEVSTANLFGDVRDELKGLAVLAPGMGEGHPGEPAAGAEGMRARLGELAAGRWHERYRKRAEKKPRRERERAKGSGSHTSVHRLRLKHQREKPEDV